MLFFMSWNLKGDFGLRILCFSSGTLYCFSGRLSSITKCLDHQMRILLLGLLKLSLSYDPFLFRESILACLTL